MKKTTTIIVMAVLCLNFCANAQVPNALKLGEKIPQQIWQQNMPALNKTAALADSIRLNEFTGKIILLDFWASWCTTCIGKFRTLEKFQEQYQDKIKILLVDTKSTKDTPQRINGVLRGENAPFIKYKLATIYGDTILNDLFPHMYIPHYIWIGSDGKLLAITNSALLSENTIDAMIATDTKIKKSKDTLNSRKP